MPPQDTPPELIQTEKNTIRTLLSESRPIKIEFINEGWDNRVYIVNGGELVFKFPRSDKIRSLQSKEIAILKLLETLQIDIALPKVVFEHPERQYFGYKGVAGRSFDEAALHLNAFEQARIGNLLGNFIKQLHGLKLAEALEVTIDEEIAWYHEKYEFALSTIAARFNDREQEIIKRFALQEMPQRLHELGIEYSLCHTDLGGYNMLLDEHGKLGIIDFGDISYRDHSKDFIGLIEPAILDAALHVYGDNQLLRDKIAIRSKANRVFDLAYYISKDDMAGLEDGLNVIQQELLS